VTYDSNVTPGGKYGTALQAASHQRKLEIVQLLLEKGANPDVEGENDIQLK
jgi:ankyrin repeat protein